MTQPRKLIVSLDQTSWYHCYCRAVRHGWLFGYDKVSGNDYSHRKAWVTDRLAVLSDIFAIDIAAYAVMSNHYHLVLRIDAQTAKSWSDKTVIRRWMRLFRGSPLTLKMLQNKPLNNTEQCKADELVEQWRGRLCDISWLMRCLNEHIAKLANAEDKCTGRFWEGRFKSQALLDEQAILTCMTYVDLNPVRAGMAQLPESSDFTAIAQRIKVLARESRAKKTSHKKGTNKTVSATIKLAKFCRPPVKSTMPIIDAVHQGQRATGTIPFYWEDYLELIDWAGRAILPNKTGYIHQSHPAILDRLGIDADDWLDNMPKIESSFHHCIGTEESFATCAQKMHQQWVKGLAASRKIFG